MGYLQIHLYLPNIPMANLAATWFANNRTTFAQKNMQIFSRDRQ